VQNGTDAQDGVMWVLAVTARAQHVDGVTHVTGSNIYHETLFDVPSAIAASDDITTAFLAEFRGVRVSFAETYEG